MLTLIRVVAGGEEGEEEEMTEGELRTGTAVHGKGMKEEEQTERYWIQVEQAEEVVEVCMTARTLAVVPFL